MRFTTLFCAGLLYSTAQAQDPGASLVPFATGFSQPIDITNAGDGTNRLFVNEKGGRIIALAADGTRLGTFLDISAKVSTLSERGLLGLAFAPDYATSGRFYINYSNTSGTTTIARYEVSAADPNLADPNSEEIILTVAQPAANHNGGDLAFDAKGLLYATSGDGGGSNDPVAAGQDLNSLLGAILRLDVSGATGYVAAGGYPGAAPEIFAAGLRNPWRISFDRSTDSLWIGDVGQNAREEIDVLTPATVGANFGWVCYEGSFNNTGVSSAARSNCQPYDTYVPPVYEYAHIGGGRSVTGGVVYRGTKFPALDGYYVFADYVTGVGYALRGTGVGQVVYEYPSFGERLVGFGESEQGEVYVAQIDGNLLRLTSTVTVVSVTEFIADSRDCMASVTWASSSETNLSHYHLEVAGEDLDWAAFAKTFPNADKRYSVSVDLSSGARYARLVSIDLDGSRTTGEVIRLEAACGPSLYVYPNPVSTDASTTVALASRTEAVRVYNALGSLVLTVDPGGQERLELPMISLAAGQYVVRQAGQVARVVVR